MSQVVAFAPKGYLRLQTILKMVPVGKSTWWAGVKAGRFPKPVKLGPNTTAWKLEDIEALMASFEQPKAKSAGGVQ